MARHENVAESLQRLQQQRMINGWVKDSDPGNPQRIHWVVSIDPVTTRRWHTSEVEAFIEGARQAGIAFRS